MLIVLNQESKYRRIWYTKEFRTVSYFQASFIVPVKNKAVKSSAMRVSGESSSFALE